MFDINTDELKAAACSLQDSSNQLNRNYHEIEDVKQLLSGMSSMEQIMGKLSSLQDEIRREAEQEDVLSNIGSMIAAKYESCEEEIISNLGSGELEFSVASPMMADFSYKHHKGSKNINMGVMKDLMEVFD